MIYFKLNTCEVIFFIIVNLNLSICLRVGGCYINMGQILIQLILQIQKKVNSLIILHFKVTLFFCEHYFCLTCQHTHLQHWSWVNKNRNPIDDPHVWLLCSLMSGLQFCCKFCCRITLFSIITSRCHRFRSALNLARKKTCRLLHTLQSSSKGLSCLAKSFLFMDSLSANFEWLKTVNAHQEQIFSSALDVGLSTLNCIRWVHRLILQQHIA